LQHVHDCISSLPKVHKSDEKMNTFAARVLVLALAAGLGSGCATAFAAKTPKFKERDLRPMNQDLAAWLDRLNAGPAHAEASAEPAPAAPTDKKEALAITPAAPVPPAMQPQQQGPTSLEMSNAASSPTASTPTATASPTPSVSAVAVTAGASSVPPTAAPAPAATSHTPGGSQPPASPPALAAAEPTAATAVGAVTTDSATTVVQAPLPPPPPAKPVWTAANGESLREAIEDWSKKADWTVVWDASVDYPIVGTLRYEGDYLDAIRGIFLAHANAEKPLRADVYTRQHLIHITE